MRRIRRAVLAAVLVTGLGCSGGDGDGGGGPDGEALAQAFGDEAEAAYEVADRDRDDDFSMGTRTDCFVLDEQGAVAVAEALGLDGAGGAEILDGSYLSGPPGRRELLTCPLSVDGETRAAAFSMGTVSGGRDEVLADMQRAADEVGYGIEEIEGDVPGLDADDVVTVRRDDEPGMTFVWVNGGFRVAIGVAEQEAGVEALPVLVDAVADTLGS